MPQRSVKTTFSSAQGDTLAARIELPEQEDPRAYALFAHCFTCSKDIPAASRISRELASRGYAVLRFDFTGLGASEGEFENTNFSSNVDDLVAAADHLRNEFRAPELLVGHSLGGAAVIAASPRIPEVKAVSTIGAPADPGHLQHMLTEAVTQIETEGEAMVDLAGRCFRIKRQFLEDIRRSSLDEILKKMRQALLVMHAPTDSTVGISNARHIYDTANHPKSFLSLDSADHLLSKSRDASYAAGVLASWAERYLPEHA